MSDRHEDPFTFKFLIMIQRLLILAGCVCLSRLALGDSGEPIGGSFGELWHSQDAVVKMDNGLWGENAPDKQFGNGRTNVVIADIKGPGIITMIHFALPEAGHLDRSAILRMYWDGETNPSVEVPLVDFFCDANGAFSRVDNIVMNKKRGWNEYFPMPFRKSARIEVDNDNPRYPNGCWAQNPCYSYVIYRKVKKLDRDTLYFHAEWRKQIWHQATEWYEILDAKGKGQLVGWNVAMRPLDPRAKAILPDENEQIYIDGETKPSLEWQGLEDAFGFSWGFPPDDNSWLYMGCQSYYATGKAAYRFFFNDRIPFKKSLYFRMGFTMQEGANWMKRLPERMTVDCSTTAYWYQTEPHKPFGPFPSWAARQPVDVETTPMKPSTPNETFDITCGKGMKDVVYLKKGWDFVFEKGVPGVMRRKGGDVQCWCDTKDLKVKLICPAGASGKLMLHIIDADKLGRAEQVFVNGREMGSYSDFSEGKWVGLKIDRSETEAGAIVLDIKPVGGHNAVVSDIKFETD
jgi:D-arabinan exo alpha-(1,3)/(1,5)-arabinofuranosidase (non-reducing end)